MSGLKVFIYDEFSPEDTAMMQALYSRSPMSVIEHAKKVKKTGSGKFMERFYVGYGHQSIADCGSTTIFCEGVSILSDKALQDWPLYCGQETSTRYVDMESQPIIDPLKTNYSKEILQAWMNFYSQSQGPLREFLKQKYPKKQTEQTSVYNKAIAARSFDILRGFLPAGITTQLSWHTNLRQAWDKLALLRLHPLSETRFLANCIYEKLQKKYAHSFSHPLKPDQENYRKFLNQQYNYYTPANPPRSFQAKTNIKQFELEKYQDIIDNRPEKTCLPHFLSELGTITFEFLLDFGSFRDIQRHRNGVCRMPLHTTQYGFEPWYLHQLSKTLQNQAKTLINNQVTKIKTLDTDDLLRQYYIPLGFRMPCKITYGLPAATYVCELRSGKPVHPTLRAIAHKMRNALLNFFPTLKLYCDLDPDEWDIRRGRHDILERNNLISSDPISL